MKQNRLLYLVFSLVLLSTVLPLKADTQKPAKDRDRFTTTSLPAPQPRSPANGVLLQSMVATTLVWDLPQGATQFHLRVTPANNDGPEVNLIRNAAGWFTLAVAPTWYVLLPGMTYSWRLRVTDKSSFAPDGDPSWGPWSETWIFRTPSPSSAGLRPVAPADGAFLNNANPFTLSWTHPDPAIFYYEVQVSGDPRFDTDPATATSFVWWNLVHGGMSSPPNSWLTPALGAGKTYFWRVRPRVQGGGATVEWSPAWSFNVPSATAEPGVAPNPYFPYPGVTSVYTEYDPTGMAIGAGFSREVANNGGAGAVIVTTVWLDRRASCSLVFPMEREEHVMVRTFLGGVRSVPTQERVEWTTRAAQPTETSETSQCGMSMERSTIRRVGMIEVTAKNVAVAGNFAYILGVNSLSIVNISSPSSPTMVGIYLFPGVTGPEGFQRYVLAAAGNYVYAVIHSYEQKDYLRVIDVSVPSAPRLVGEFPIEGHKVYDLAIAGSYVYLATDASGVEYLTAGSALVVVDISDPANPRKVAEYKPDRSGYYPISVAVRGSYAYLVDRSYLYVIDVSVPTSPREVARGQHGLSSGTLPNNEAVAVAGDYAYVTSWNSRLVVFNVSAPANTGRAAEYYLSATRKYSLQGIAASGNIIYLGGYDGLFVLDLSDLSGPSDAPRQANIIGRYLGTLINVQRVVLSGSYAYLAAGDALHIVSAR